MMRVKLRPGREGSLKARHPWVFNGAIADDVRGLERGATVLVQSADGHALALGAVSPASQIAVRVWTFDTGATIDAGFFAGRIAAALARRGSRGSDNGARRIVNAESDQLPGLVVDQYCDYLVCQFLAAGTEYWREAIVAALAEQVRPRGIWERSDVDVRQKEGLEPRTGLLWGEAPPEHIAVEVAGLRFEADVRAGHKTGLYLDQAANLGLVGSFAAGREVLNCFAYTGAFSLACLRGGAARVTSIESSQDAVDASVRHVALNGLDAARTEPLCGDVFKLLRTFRDSRRAFDMVVLDPPKFVVNASQITKGGRGYKDINLLAIKLLRPGGILVTFSCSGHVMPDLFQKIVADAAQDSGRHVQITHWLAQGADHPVGTGFPEGRYLKGLICRAD